MLHMAKDMRLRANDVTILQARCAERTLRRQVRAAMLFTLAEDARTETECCPSSRVSGKCQHVAEEKMPRMHAHDIC